MSERMSETMPARRSEFMLDILSDRMSESFSDRMSQFMLDSMPRSNVRIYHGRELSK